MPNGNLAAAKRAKNDEFYTQLSDIEKELSHYREHFEGKTILCNCDDPTWSNFWQYFHLGFEFFGLKKLIATHYEYDETHSSYAMIYEGGNDIDVESGIKLALNGNGDFRSAECIEFLKEADIVVTNPPFSLFREYVAQLMGHGKKFIIIGNMNAITYKEIFPLIKDNRIWYGASITSGDRKFGVPDSYPLNAAGCGIDDNGQRFIRVKGVRWFTNIDIPKRHEPIALVEHYTPEKYPRYDNYDVIEVTKTLSIPKDYDGVMGVPVSFLDKYCPEQFEIVGMAEDNGKGFSGDSGWDGKNPHCVVSGKNMFKRIFIRRKVGT